MVGAVCIYILHLPCSQPYMLVVSIRLWCITEAHYLYISILTCRLWRPIYSLHSTSTAGTLVPRGSLDTRPYAISYCSQARDQPLMGSKAVKQGEFLRRRSGVRAPRTYSQHQARCLKIWGLQNFFRFSRQTCTTHLGDYLGRPVKAP